METTIRPLHYGDSPQVLALDTGIEDDYVKNIFERLVEENNHLFGLFQDGQLVSIAGYTIYARSYAMLGRLRSDRRFKGNGFSTSLLTHALHAAFHQPDIQWAGANTQEHNLPAQRVIEKNGLSNYATLHGAVTKDTSALTAGAKPWNPVTNLQRKRDWINQTYVKSGQVFPYECYYPFPASMELFQDEDLEQWAFYENNDQTRMLITKTDQKKNHYLHAVYPWSDITSQPGLWETISSDYESLKETTGEDTYIWMDVTKEEAQILPANHGFELPSPWILYGIDRTNWEKLMGD
ncbi:GNAT family N-acetyltransferase [Virgibacillus sp. NKC19-3]|uniref:GNAT family N-acetyltransferase n=1 Tax=Virgibacillus saliphilus TaxID=2831674 RepID=UPI001C9B8E02|nr:GNAT family N-acetyltransferase [Virgibacillus sp. NKC19-3]MBY7143149.1 GNAT family N-acetyltransferase [Virgibacillus sp. NKC19-3]